MELGLSSETEISRGALADLFYVEPVGLWWSNVLNLALPSQRLRPDTRPEHKDSVSHMARYVSSFLPFGKYEVFCQHSVGVL